MVNKVNRTIVTMSDELSGNTVGVDSEGQMNVVLKGTVCTGCSSSTPLAAGATFTGTATDMLDYGIVFVTVYTDQDSANGGLSLEQSSDGTNWDIKDAYTITGTLGKVFSIPAAAKYFRVVYTNGDTPQTEFRLQSVLKKTNGGNEGQSIIGVDYVDGNSGIDSATETLQTITYEHHEIHAGSHFMISGFETLANNAQANFVVTTPNTTKWAHMTFEIEGTSQTEMYIYEGATVTGGTGTATPAFNNDRNSLKASTLTILKNPTTPEAGTLIYSQSKGLSGATPSKATSGGIVSREREIILKQNTTYIFRIISKDNGNIVTYCGEWYEHTNKN